MIKKDEAMKQALEAQIHKAGMNPVMQGECYLMHPEALQKLIEVAIREALAEQPAQQEPVAWMHEWEDGERIPMLTGRDDRNTDRPKSVRPLVYGDTPPAQRKPLTDEQQIAEALRRHGLTLVKTAKGYDVMSLGHITAHGITKGTK